MRRRRVGGRDGVQREALGRANGDRRSPARTSTDAFRRGESRRWSSAVAPARSRPPRRRPRRSCRGAPRRSTASRGDTHGCRRRQHEHDDERRDPRRRPRNQLRGELVTGQSSRCGALHSRACGCATCRRSTSSRAGSTIRSPSTPRARCSSGRARRSAPAPTPATCSARLRDELAAARRPRAAPRAQRDRRDRAHEPRPRAARRRPRSSAFARRRAATRTSSTTSRPATRGSRQDHVAPSSCAG